MHKRIRFLIIVAVIVTCVMVPSLAVAQEDTEPKPEYSTLAELSNKELGTVLGTTYDADVNNRLSENPTFKYYGEMSEMLLALKYKRIEACCLDKPVARIAVERNAGLAIMPDDAGPDANAVALPKGSSLTPYVSNIVERLVEDGTMEELEHEWCDLPESERSLPAKDWNGSNGVLVVAVDDATEPMSYRSADGELRGLEVELAYIIARELNMDLDLRPMPFDAIMLSLSSYDVDMAIAGISITDERSQLYDLTPAYRSAIVTLVTRDVSSHEMGLLENIVQMIRSTFFHNGHGWLFITGVAITLLLTFSSVPIGTILGYLLGALIVCLSRPLELGGKSKRVAWILRLLSRIARTILLGFQIVFSEVPIVIVLLVLRYLVFDFATMPGGFVAVIGLSSALTATVAGIVRDAIDSLGSQPWEIASSMGYTTWKAFGRIISPMARRQFMPALFAAITQSVFDTSVVGLIAVHDMTRVADLVRARSTEALPAMIATAVVYLAISSALEQALKAFTKRVQKTNRYVSAEGEDAA